MPMSDAPIGAANFRLVAGQPAHLEVTIDPAAHGEAGLGPIRRGVTVKTTSGQELQFELAAQVIR